MKTITLTSLFVLALLFTALTGFAPRASAQGGMPLWTNFYTGGPYGVLGGAAIAVDNSGNVLVTAPFPTDNSGDNDYLTIKYSNAGVMLWARRYNGPGAASGFSDDEPTAIAVDSSGNVFVTGKSSPPGTAGGGIGQGHDWATIAYSSAGVQLWVNRYGPPDGDVTEARAIAVDSAGHVFVSGRAYDGVHPQSQFTTIAYSGTGVPLWTNFALGYEVFANAVDSSGNLFVTGNTIDGNSSLMTIKYSSSISTPPHLDFQNLNNQLVLSWTNAAFSLQSAPDVSGTFTNIPAATSPFTNPLTAPQQFFRLIGN